MAEALAKTVQYTVISDSEEKKARVKLYAKVTKIRFPVSEIRKLKDASLTVKCSCRIPTNPEEACRWINEYFDTKTVLPLKHALKEKLQKGAK